MAESTDDDSIMVSKSQEYNIKHYSDSMINTSNQVCSKQDRTGLPERLPPQTVVKTVLIQDVHVKA